MRISLRSDVPVTTRFAEPVGFTTQCFDGILYSDAADFRGFVRDHQIDDAISEVNERLF